MERIIGILNGMGFTAGTGVATALMNSVLFEIENKESYNAESKQNPQIWIPENHIKDLESLSSIYNVLFIELPPLPCATFNI